VQVIYIDNTTNTVYTKKVQKFLRQIYIKIKIIKVCLPQGKDLLSNYFKYLRKYKRPPIKL